MPFHSISSVKAEATLDNNDRQETEVDDRGAEIGAIIDRGRTEQLK
jgi:hypothetical protein